MREIYILKHKVNDSYLIENCANLFWHDQADEEKINPFNFLFSLFFFLLGNLSYFTDMDQQVQGSSQSKKEVGNVYMYFK